MARQNEKLTFDDLQEIQQDLRQCLLKALDKLDQAEKSDEVERKRFNIEFGVVEPLFYRLCAHLADWCCESLHPCLKEMQATRKMIAEKYRFNDNRFEIKIPDSSDA